MKAPKQHNWMGADLSSSGPQPRPYVWMYDEGQYDHHVLQFRQDRTRDAALLATAAFESSGLSLSGPVWQTCQYQCCTRSSKASLMIGPVAGSL